MENHINDIEVEPLNMSELHGEEAESTESENSSGNGETTKRSVDNNSESKQAELSTGPSSEQSASTISHDDEIVFVKLRLPHGKQFTLTAYRNMKVRELKNVLSDEFKIPPNIIDLWENIEYPVIIDDNDKEISLFDIKNNRLDLYINSRDRDIDLLIPDDKIVNSVDILTVTIDTDGTQVVVEIENSVERRFLGGFRCRKTNKEYFHAETQTHTKYLKKLSTEIIKWSRSCQTNVIIHTLQQTSVTQATQTVECEGGDERQIEQYSSSDSSSESEELQHLTNKVILIQRIWRGWKVRQAMETRQVKVRKMDSKSDKFSGYSPAVFEVLYQLVERWRKKCLDHAYASKTEGPTRADFQDILEMQVNLLAIIERERVKMREKIQREKERRMLEESSSPVTWKGYKGITISMETIQSQRAAELKKLYDLLSQENIPTEQRREHLGTVQAALKNQKDAKCEEILTLLNRELQLLEMGFGYKEVESLHRRIEKLFINFIKDPKKIKNITSKDKFYLCIQCKKMLPPTSFVIPLNEPAIKLCTSCHWMDNISHKRVDHNPYQLILRELRRAEMKKGCYKSLAFIMEVHDIRHLVDQVWHCQSAISQCADLKELRLGRWDTSQDWAPWNTILLTKSELQEHSDINELHQIYGQNFIRNIKVKLLMAQMHFKSLHNLKFDL